MELKLKFESNQPHQLKAVESTVKLFDGFPKYETEFEMGEDIRPNLPEYSSFEENWLLDNLNEVQRINGLEESANLEYEDGLVLEGTGDESWRYPSYTIDMETGTGKTYVYLKTILELKKNYGFRKFIIIVPSIAIYEGVIKTYKITREHFKTLYGNETTNLIEYDGQELSKLRDFASSSFIEIMVMTIDSFNKTSNKIFKATEKLMGEMLPYQYIQGTKPILILDESQNYRNEKRKAALRTLHPLFALKYSATPVDNTNLIYNLTPVEAFKQNLVKKIEVFGVTQEANYNDPQMSMFVDAVNYSSSAINANIKLFVRNKSGELNLQSMVVKKGDDLYKKTKNINYEGFIIKDIDRKKNTIVFLNGSAISINDEKGLILSKQEIFKVQIEEAIKHHIQKQNELYKKGIKVLTLFFIDKVDNYVSDEGIIRVLFDSLFEKYKDECDLFKKLTPDEVREAYFAKRKNKSGIEEIVDTKIEEEEKTKDDKDLEKKAYELIMKNKEKLLSFNEKVCFIFAHSALKEGWDNPNVFQICTLNQTFSDRKKRQEIGRGMRLCVDQSGERVLDEGVNILTVIANESYEEYVRNLQKQYVDDGDIEPNQPSDARKTSAKRNDKIFRSKDFKEFWDKLSMKTDYKIKINSPDLIKDCIIKLNGIHFPEPHIAITKGKFVITDFKLSLIQVTGKIARIHISISDTEGENVKYTTSFKEKDDLSKKTRDERFRGYKILEIKEQGDDSYVEFDNGKILTKYQEINFHSEKGQITSPRTVRQAQTLYPVFNIIQRASNELGLTKPTLLEVFKKLKDDKKNIIFKNPEGFYSIFYKTIRDLLADHISDKIEYNISKEKESYDIDLMFPESKKFPQKELLEGTKTSMYDKIQIDSDVEKRFVENRLKIDDKVICYFKFPNTFKIGIPKIIENYNPDWGIIRIDDSGKYKLQLVRETKGTMNPNLLQFPSEKRKIDCATKHFKCIEIDYRQVTDDVINWWKSKE